MIESGQILQGRYRVERQVGQGGMGAVYIATDERFGSTVAIKETLFTDDKFRKAFEREARLLNSLRHPALPRVSDHFIEGNGQFLVMEYIAGEDLSEQIENEGRSFTISEVLDWADQLLDALDYLHSQVMPVVHRDIKPQNLKLTPQGKIVLLDFGLAKGNTTNPESATAAKSVFGYSRNYASLEQIQGTGTDPRSDLYSLAATIYHLLAGNPPVDALTRAMNVLSDKPDPAIPISKVLTVPEAVSEVLAKSMSLNANERPVSAAEMRSMLSAASKGEIFAAAATFVERAPDTNLFNQETRVHPADSGIRKQSDVLTETLSENISKETKLKASIPTGDVGAATAARTDPSGRRPMFAAIAVGSLFLFGGAAGAVYMFGPDWSKSANVPAANIDSNRRVAENEPGNSNAESNVNGNLSPIAAENPSASPVKTDPVTRPDQKTETRVEDPRADEAVQAQPKSSIDEVRGDPAANRSSTPPPTAQLPSPPPRDPRTNQVIPPEVWRKMTPLQRKKLRRALELQREQQNQPPDPDDN